MLHIKKSKRFKKDFKKVVANSHFQRNNLEYVIGVLMSGRQLEKKFLTHQLKGIYPGCIECHVQSDILLIYEIDEKLKELYLLRIGSHSELF